MIVLIPISIATIIFICMIYSVASHGVDLPLSNRPKYIIIKQILGDGSYIYVPMQKGLFFYDDFGGDSYREHFATYKEAEEYLKFIKKRNNMTQKEIINVDI